MKSLYILFYASKDMEAKHSKTIPYATSGATVLGYQISAFFFN